MLNASLISLKELFLLVFKKSKNISPAFLTFFGKLSNISLRFLNFLFSFHSVASAINVSKNMTIHILI